MLIFVQFPVADLRLFVEAQTGHLHTPFWPSPKPYQEFIRSFGIVRKRGKGGIQGWVGENEICDAKHAIKIDKPIAYKFMNEVTASDTEISLKCKSRHFYFDGITVAKFEMIFVTTPTNIDLSPKTFSTFMLDFFKTPIEIAIPPNPTTPTQTDTNAKAKTKKLSTKFVLLEDLGTHLAKLYLASTTKKYYLPGVKNIWTLAGEPIFWVELGPEERLPVLPHSRQISSPLENDIALIHWDVSPQKKTGKECLGHKMP